MLCEVLETMRPYQWYKNLVLFAGLTFAGTLFVFPLVIKAVVAFVIFCLLSGAGYIINDVADRKSDSHHPEKSKRPISSGTLRGSHALIVAISAFLVGNAAAFLLSNEFGWCALTYSVVTVSYSGLLKRIGLIDVITISVGFVIRAVAGAVVIDVFISPWLILCAFMLALFLALGKRKQEKSSLYSAQILNQLLTITTALVIMSYSLYTFLRASHIMMVSIPLVLYGLFRYLQLSQEEREGSKKIELVFQDKGLLMTLSLWIILVIAIIYVWE